MRGCVGLGTVLIATILAPGAFASRRNDGAAEIANGGLRARKETRVRMAKERLFISLDKVRVEYEFINDSNRDVETVVAFPWPAYRQDLATRTWDPSMLAFSVEVDGVRVAHRTEVRAILGNGTDITSRLQQLGINIPFFGFHDAKDALAPELRGRQYQVVGLGWKDQEALIRLGAIDKEDLFPQWSVQLSHYWTQRFPARARVKIVHEYVPIVGSTNVVSIEGLSSPGGTFYYEPGCADEAIRAEVAKRSANLPTEDHPRVIGTFWVKYILTTANTWNGPIRDFELIIDRNPGELVTFCWEGPVSRIGPNRFRAARKDFRPERELTVYFLKP